MVDWSKVRFEPRCKICNLYKTDRVLFDQLHKMVLHTGFTQERTKQWLNSKIASMNEDLALRGAKKKPLPFFNGTNFSYHFRNHLPIDLATALKIRTSSINAVRPENEESEVALQKIMNEAVRSNMSDYNRLSDLAERMERRFSDLEKQLDAQGMTWSRVQDYTTFIKELARMRQDLIKLKQSEKLISTIVSQVLHTYTVGSLKEILRTVEQVRSELEAIDSDIANRVAHKLREAVVGGMEANAKEAVSTIRKEFKLSL